MSENLGKEKNLDLNSLNVHSDFTDTNKIVNITSTDNDLLTSGNLLNIEHTGNANTVVGPIVNISSTTTSTSLDSVLKVSNTSQTAGNVLEIEGKTDKNALNVTQGNIIYSGDLKGATRFQSHTISQSTLTDFPNNNQNLIKNSFYSSNADTRTVFLPSATTCDIGDFITIFYNTEIGDSKVHTYQLDDNDTSFSLSSSLTRVGGAVASKVELVTTNDKKKLVINGKTNGDGGQGTTIKFVNVDKSKTGWAVEVIIYNQGNGTVASTSTFST